MRKSNTFTAVAIAVGIAGAAALGSPAMADDDDYRRAARSPQAGLSIGDVYQRLTADGYTRIEEIGRDDGKYEVEARDSQGREVELDIDARTGRILKVEYED